MKRTSSSKREQENRHMLAKMFSESFFISGALNIWRGFKKILAREIKKSAILGFFIKR